MKRVEFKINEDDEAAGVKTMSIVPNPAIDSDFIVLHSQRHETLKKYVRVLLMAYDLGNFKTIDAVRGNESRDKFKLTLRLLFQELQLKKVA